MRAPSWRDDCGDLHLKSILQGGPVDSGEKRDDLPYSGGKRDDLPYSGGRRGRFPYSGEKRDAFLTPGEKRDAFLTPGEKRDAFLTPGEKRDAFLTREKSPCASAFLMSYCTPQFYSRRVPHWTSR